MSMSRLSVAALVIAVLLAACGGVPGSSAVPTQSEGHPAEPDGRIDPRDGLERLQAYGAEHADSFGGLYLDQPAGRTVVMLFTRDLDRHARAAAALAPAGMTVRVEQARFTEAELLEVLEGIDPVELAAGGVEMISAGLDVINNVVALEAKSNVPGVEHLLEARHGGRLDVTIHPLPGPWSNAEAGDGWRLLAVGRGDAIDAFGVRAATDAATWRALWDGIRIDGSEPSVDLGDEVVVSFAHGIGSSCPELRLDDVVIDRDLVFSVVSDPLGPRACTADLAGSVVFVVALERRALPDDGFTLRLTEEFGDQLDVRLP
jgi:hypothetical protein